jgi:prepilin-type N-terminal cleavage/methylation domain-containing protein
MRERRAFTLVELLVVIGIIAVLVAILLPVLGSARRQAGTAKCAAQMRDVGNSMVMYAQENKGFLPPVRLNTPYVIGAVKFDKGGAEVLGKSVDEHAKWWHFLGKYLTKKVTMAQTPGQMSDMMSSSFWCSAFAGYSDGSGPNILNGVNRNFTGIGMNCWPGFTPTYPPAGSDPALENGAVIGGKAFGFFDCLATNVANRGSWYKLSQFTKPGERALLADSRQFYLEARRLPPNTPIPGQRLLFAQNDYSSGVVGQAMHDFYRHGVYPGAANADSKNGYFKTTGGKISYNILFADNHVITAVDRDLAYRSCRMRFPD